jgi:hypothetical protein
MAHSIMSFLKNGVFWDVTPYGSCKNGRFGGTYPSIIRITRIGELGTTVAVISNRNTLRRTTDGVLKLLVTTNVGLSSMILFALMMEAKYSYEPSVLTRARRCHITRRQHS